MLPVVVVRTCSDASTIRYVLPVFWMTSCFHIMREPVDQNQAWRYVSSSSPGGVTGAKCAISDCILLMDSGDGAVRWRVMRATKTTRVTLLPIAKIPILLLNIGQIVHTFIPAGPWHSAFVSSSQSIICNLKKHCIIPGLLPSVTAFFA